MQVYIGLHLIKIQIPMQMQMQKQVQNHIQIQKHIHIHTGTAIDTDTDTDPDADANAEAQADANADAEADADTDTGEDTYKAQSQLVRVLCWDNLHFLSDGLLHMMLWRQPIHVTLQCRSHALYSVSARHHIGYVSSCSADRTP